MPGQCRDHQCRVFAGLSFVKTPHEGDSHRTCYTASLYVIGFTRALLILARHRVRGVELLEAEVPGFWEQNGFREERYSS
jgi:hypothetical protein